MAIFMQLTISGTNFTVLVSIVPQEDISRPSGLRRSSYKSRTELSINGRKLKLGTDYLPRLSTNWAEAQEQLISSPRIRVNDS